MRAPLPSREPEKGSGPCHPPKKGCRLNLLGLIAFLALYLYLDWLWLRNFEYYKFLFDPDLTDQMVFGLQIYRGLLDKGLLGSGINCSYSFPPFLYLVTSLFYSLGGVSFMMAALSIFPFLVLLGFSMYRLGELLGGRTLGWMMLLLASTAPPLLFEEKRYFQDVPVLALTALSLYLLLRAEDFRNRKYSIFFGMAFAQGMLLKVNYLLFLFAPFLLFAVFPSLQALRPTKYTRNRDRVINIFCTSLM